MVELNSSGEVRASGGVVLRDGDGGADVLVVHRPKYDDWTLPKGKAEPGESDEACARREVEEETGLHCELGPELRTLHYRDHLGRPKAVRYWEMRPVRGAFTPTEEIDEVRWLPAADAAELLTYREEAGVLVPYLRPRRSTTLLLVRHAVALRRGEWDGSDRYRPLSPRGRKQADALVDALGPFGVARVLSSPATRCVETVGPLAASAGVDVEEVEDLFEGHGTDALPLVLSCGIPPNWRDSTRQNEALVVCSHGDLLPELLRAVAGHAPDDIPYDPPFAKGAAWVVEEAGARYLPPPA